VLRHVPFDVEARRAARVPTVGQRAGRRIAMTHAAERERAQLEGAWRLERTQLVELAVMRDLAGDGARNEGELVGLLPRRNVTARLQAPALLGQRRVVAQDAQ